MKPRTLFNVGALALGAVIANRWLAARRRRIELAGQSVVVTGGSRGLGLLLANEFSSRGARVTLLARDPVELSQARRWLDERGAHEVITIVCDVGERSSVEDAITEVLNRRGRLDILVNNAGLIQVGPLDHMDIEDYERAMAVHFWGPLYAIHAALPAMRRQGGGRIVNISSIGGKVAIPHLAPYVASKFALSGLSDAMRSELAQAGIHVTTVAPGLMRTGSHVNVSIKGQHQREYAWFALGASAPLLAMEATQAARRIVEAARRGQRSLILGAPARLLIAAEALAPALLAELMTWVGAALPAPVSADANATRSGWESHSRWAPSRLTRLGDRAATRHNELQDHEKSELLLD